MNQPLLLSMQSIHKKYPGVHALKGVTLELRAGECHALLGENGAGKSTLMKILAGAERMDSGTLVFQDTPRTIESPHHAQQLGIAMIYQELNLIPTMSVAENIFLGREPTRGGLVDNRRMNEESRAILDRLGVPIDVRKPVSELSIARQQMVEIAKAVSIDARIIVMDEPSATLTNHELQHLFRLIHTLKNEGMGIMYISHRLEEVFEVCDRVTILRDGEWIETTTTETLTRERIIEKMVGRTLADEFPKSVVEPGKEIVRLEGLSRGAVQDVSFSVHQGEVVALTGLVGSGRTEVARMVFGADVPERGAVFLHGKPVRLTSPRDAIDAGIGYLSEDRKEEGLVLDMRVRENVTLPSLAGFCFGGMIRFQEERKHTGEKIRDLHIKTPSGETLTRNLSGGNQQKVVLAKWLLAHSGLLIFDEPTRGIDVGAKREIYLLMNELVAQGAGILMISSELPEVLGMADRVLVMCEGRLAGELARKDATQEAIMNLATPTRTVPVSA